MFEKKMSQKDIEEKFMNTLSNLSNISQEQTKLESSLNNFNTQSSFHSHNNSLYYSKKNKNQSKTDTPVLKCTCRPKGLNTVPRQRLKCTCNKKNLFKGYETEIKKSQFEQINPYAKYNRMNKQTFISDLRGNHFQNNINYRRNNYGSHSVNTKICTCRKYQKPNLKYLNLQNDKYLGQIYQSQPVAASPYSSKLSSLYKQNIEFFQRPIKILIPIPENKIDFTYRLEILGTPLKITEKIDNEIQKQKEEIKEEKKEEPKEEKKEETKEEKKEETKEEKKEETKEEKKEETKEEKKEE